MKTPAVVLLSGGMDSTTALCQALADGMGEIYPITFDYGSLHAAREIQAAWKVVDWLQELGEAVNDITQVKLPKDIFAGAGSALMGEQKMPEMSYQEIAQAEGPSPTVVPFRNGVFIALATAFAITKGAGYVYAGMHGEDARNWAYPDCTPEFLGAMANATYVGSYSQVRLSFPFVWMSKCDVVTRASLVTAPLHLTWSCYKGGEKHCGVCPTCVERIEAFREAGFVDPVEYAIPVQFSGEKWI